MLEKNFFTFVVLIPIVAFGLILMSGATVDALLDENESGEKCKGVTCISGIVDQSSCPDGTIFQENMIVFNCCPACVKFATVNDTCEIPDYEFSASSDNIILENGMFVSKDCAPGLECYMDPDTWESTCQPKHDSCDSYQYKDGIIWYPACEPNGDFSAVQHKGDFISGRRFCYNKRGKRIFGQAWEKDAIDMTCACSREVESILSKRERTDVSLHCSGWGNYEALQCDDNLCWCAEPKTGVPQSVTVPIQMAPLLPCYIKEESGEKYLRQCESSAVAAGLIQDILVQHGTTKSYLGVDFCDPDGSYGSFQIFKDQVRCTWKDRTTIGGYAQQISEIKSVNCNCARDSILYQENDLTNSLQCGGNGNYNPLQISGEMSFCVDSDGYPTKLLFNETNCSF